MKTTQLMLLISGLVVLMLLISGLVFTLGGGSTTVTERTGTGGVTIISPTTDAKLAAALKATITVEFTECPFAEVIDYLRKSSDVNFIVSDTPEATVTLSLKNMPLEQVIRYLGELTGMEATAEENAVVFRPKAADAAKAGTGANNYKMETSVESAKEAHQYLVAVKIHQSPDGKKWDVLAAPCLLVLAGEEGKIEVKDQKTGDGVECTVLVREVAAGTVEMNVACKVKETGKPQWQSELKTRIKLP